MYRDNTLTPSEAIRLLALGLLADRPRSYAALARDVRYFIGHIVGPSLDLVAQPIEILKIEGLISLDDDSDEPPLIITAQGRAALDTLLGANVRPPVNDINKLIIALKMRFLHLLPIEQRRLQTEVLMEMCERELARLIELRANEAGSPGHLVGWLDHDIRQTRERLAWFSEVRDSLA